MIKRVRFFVNKEACNNDYRPVTWPIKYPYWCSGETNDSFILIAYASSLDELFKQWPEAIVTEQEDVEKIEFTSRFPRPSWYTENA